MYQATSGWIQKDVAAVNVSSLPQQNEFHKDTCTKTKVGLQAERLTDRRRSTFCHGRGPKKTTTWLTKETFSNFVMSIISSGEVVGKRLPYAVTKQTKVLQRGSETSVRAVKLELLSRHNSEDGRK